jgi:hypothetical protein
MLQQLWHVLFGHEWLAVEHLPSACRNRYVIERVADISMYSYYARCKCGLMAHRVVSGFSL